MAREEYFVLHHDGAWRIYYKEKYYGPYPNQADAIQSAVNAAKTTHLQGHNAQVHIQGTNGQYRTEYTYGNDPVRYPG